MAYSSAFLLAPTKEEQSMAIYRQFIPHHYFGEKLLFSYLFDATVRMDKHSYLDGEFGMKSYKTDRRRNIMKNDLSQDIPTSRR